jgi:hypothetical protein
MTAEALRLRLAEVCRESLPLPGQGRTGDRLNRLLAVAREDLTLAKLAEAHWDAVAILAEAGRQPVAGAIYAVWASELPGRTLLLMPEGASGAACGSLRIEGLKPFCSGAGLVDRALVTAGEQMVEIDLRAEASRIAVDGSAWKTEAFRLTCTSAVTFSGALAEAVGEPGWYTGREGFWHGACGVAACWAGGAAGLVDWANRARRDDPHTLAHLAAMHAELWAMQTWLAAAAAEIDAVAAEIDAPSGIGAAPANRHAAEIRALTLRHLVEQACTEVLRRFGRAYGPYPLAMEADTSRRVQELELYLRQSHGERDLESLARALRR